MIQLSGCGIVLLTVVDVEVLFRAYWIVGHVISCDITICDIRIISGLHRELWQWQWVRGGGWVKRRTGLGGVGQGWEWCRERRGRVERGGGV